MFHCIDCSSLSLPDTDRKEFQWDTTSIVPSCCPEPLSQLPTAHWLVGSFISQHGRCVPALAVPLITALDLHHGEKTQKEIILAAQAICSMDSVLELWTWIFSLEPAHLFLTPGLNGLFYTTTQNAPASCMGISAFRTAGRLPAIGRNGANERSSIRLWSHP